MLQSDILEHAHSNTLRENCLAPSKEKQLAIHKSYHVCWICHWCSEGDAAVPHLK